MITAAPSSTVAIAAMRVAQAKPRNFRSRVTAFRAYAWTISVTMTHLITRGSVVNYFGSPPGRGGQSKSRGQKAHSAIPPAKKYKPNPAIRATPAQNGKHGGS